MARVRTIKPDAFKSETLSRVSRGARWTFAGLWTYVDDAGRGIYNPRLIWAELYPLDDATTVQDVIDDLEALEAIGAIVRYEVDGKVYLAIPAFDKHQSAAYRRTESKLPAPEEGNLQTSSNKGMKKVARREGKGREVVLAQSADADDATDDAQCATDAQAPDRFEEFWDAYAHKVDRKRAEQKWRLALKKPGVDADTLIEAAKRYIAAQKAAGKHPQFTKHADAWLNGECWNDEVRPLKAVAETPKPQDDTSWMRRRPNNRGEAAW